MERDDDKDYRCHAAPIPGSNGRCRIHGGMSLSVKVTGDGEIAKGRAKYAAFAPDSVVRKMVNADTDKELISLRGEITLIEARIHQLLERVEAEEAGVIWEKARDTLSKWQRSTRLAQEAVDAHERKRHESRAREYMLELDELINRGASDHMVWAEISKQLAEKRRMAESETKRMAQIEGTMTQKQAMEFALHVYDLVAENVTDVKALSNIQKGLTGLMGTNTNQVEAETPAFIEGDYEYDEEVIVEIDASQLD